MAAIMVAANIEILTMTNGPTKRKGRAGRNPVTAKEKSSPNCEPGNGSPSSNNTKTPSAQPDVAPILLARLEYAARGWWTFPAPADGSKKSLKSAKRSGGARWGATRDPEVIRKEFTQRFKRQNVGIMTGFENGFFVTETDTAEHGVDGAAGLQALEATHGPLPDTLMAVSPSGSVHRYFNHPGEDIKIKNSASVIAPGVDIRGDGGMVLAPPSYRPPKPATADEPAKAGGYYEWINPGTPIADAPQWLLDLVIDKSVDDEGTKFRINNREPVDKEKVKAALKVLSPDCKEWEWAKIARCVCDGLGEDGWPLFHEWSATGNKYKDEADCRYKWDRAKAGKLDDIHVDTLFYLANQADPSWRGPRVLDPANPIASARSLITETYTSPEGLRKLHRHRGAFWQLCLS